MNKNNLKFLRSLHGRIHEQRLNAEYKLQTDSKSAQGYLKSFRNEKNEGTEDYPVDFVVLWVDGNDPEWQKEKDLYLPNDENIKKSNSSARFRDWDIFKYWFRAVEKYAPWVRNVYLVTWGHVPDFIDLESPKLKFVKHSDFMPQEYLPTFSCFPTELNLWRIEGISEHIVYFNDDMFLTRPVEKSDFFSNGFPKYSAVAEPVYPYYHMTAWRHNLFNTAGVANDIFDIRACISENSDKWFSHLYTKQERELNHRVFMDQKIMGMHFSHLGVPYRCSTMRQVWERIPDRLDSTCRNRFRTMDDVFHQIFQMWEIFNGTFDAVGTLYYGRFVNVSKDNADHVKKDMLSHKYRMMCLNDSEIVSDDDYYELKDKFQSAFETLFPEKSSFEK